VAAGQLVPDELILEVRACMQLACPLEQHSPQRMLGTGSNVAVGSWRAYGCANALHTTAAASPLGCWASAGRAGLHP
jgi:hypothetical protein